MYRGLVFRLEGLPSTNEVLETETEREREKRERERKKKKRRRRREEGLQRKEPLSHCVEYPKHLNTAHALGKCALTAAWNTRKLKVVPGLHP